MYKQCFSKGVAVGLHKVWNPINHNKLFGLGAELTVQHVHSRVS